MPEKVVRRSKIAEVFALVAVAISLITSATVYGVNYRANARNTNAIKQIQINRAQITYDLCIETNRRHDNTFAYLDKLINRALQKATTATQKAQIAQSSKQTKILINDLTPKKNCIKLVKDLLGSDAIAKITLSKKK